MSASLTFSASSSSTAVGADGLNALAERLIDVYGVKETEQNWQEMNQLLVDMLKVVNLSEAMIVCEVAWKIQDPLVAALQTERTRLALSAMELISSMCGHVRDKFEGLYEVYLTPLLKLAERTNRVFNAKAQSVLLAMISVDPVIGCKHYIGKIADALTSPNKVLRGCAAQMLLEVVRAQKKIECHEYAKQTSELTVNLLTDALPNVRQTGRLIFAELGELEQQELVQKLPPNVLKSLGIASNGKDATLVTLQDLKIASSSQASTLCTPSKGLFVDLAKASTEKAANNNNINSNATLSNQASFSRIPIGPAKRNPNSVPLSSAQPISKNAIRVIRGVFSNDDDLLQQHKFNDIPMNKIMQTDKMAKTELRFADLYSMKEWNKKSEYIESIRLHSTQWTNNMSAKLWENAMTAMGDVHFRVSESGLRLATDILNHPSIEKDRFLEDVYVKVAGALLTHRTRKGVVDSCHFVLDALHFNVSCDKLLAGVYPNVMSRLDVLGSAKLKGQLLRLCEETVKRGITLLSSRQSLAQTLRSLVQKVSSCLTDHDQTLAQSTRGFFLVVIGAVGRRLFEEELLSNVRSHASRALLSALIEANPSLLPRSPCRHLAIDDDDDEVFVSQNIPLAYPLPLTPLRNKSATKTTATATTTTVDELADKLSMTPIK